MRAAVSQRGMLLCERRHLALDALPDHCGDAAIAHVECVQLGPFITARVHSVTMGAIVEEQFSAHGARHFRRRSGWHRANQSTAEARARARGRAFAVRAQTSARHRTQGRSLSHGATVCAAGSWIGMHQQGAPMSGAAHQRGHQPDACERNPLLSTRRCIAAEHSPDGYSLRRGSAGKLHFTAVSDVAPEELAQLTRLFQAFGPIGGLCRHPPCCSRAHRAIDPNRCRSLNLCSPCFLPHSRPNTLASRPTLILPSKPSA